MNDIDAFRTAFFEKIIQEENEKEAARKLKQKNCFHSYVMDTNQQICSKCEYVPVKQKMHNKQKLHTKECVIS